MKLGMWAGTLAALPAFLCGAVLQVQAERLPAGQVQIQGTRLVAVLSDGSTLTGEALTGAEVEVGDPSGSYVARIDRVMPDPTSTTGMMLYDVSVVDPAAAGGRPSVWPTARA